MNTLKGRIIAGLLALVALLGGYNAMDNLGSSEGFTRNITVIDAVTASTTSKSINIDAATRVTLYLEHTSLDTATTTFSVDVSLDGTNFVDYNKLVDNVANSISQNKTRVSSKALVGTDESYILSLDLSDDVFKDMRITATIDTATTTTATVKALINN